METASLSYLLGAAFRTAETAEGPCMVIQFLASPEVAKEVARQVAADFNGEQYPWGVTYTDEKAANGDYYILYFHLRQPDEQVVPFRPHQISLFRSGVLRVLKLEHMATGVTRR